MNANDDPARAEVIAADNAFFDALLAADHAGLANILAEDFLIVDVMSGQVTDRDTILGAIASAQLQFIHVTRDPGAVSVRRRPDTAVVVGHTLMSMRFAGVEVTADSRYTHVFVRDRGKWRLLAAQGTPVTQG